MTNTVSPKSDVHNMPVGGKVCSEEPTNREVKLNCKDRADLLSGRGTWSGDSLILVRMPLSMRSPANVYSCLRPDGLDQPYRSTSARTQAGLEAFQKRKPAVKGA